MNCPIFVSLEGIEAVGKTLLTRKLTETLEKLGVPCVSTREPGGTEISQKIRTILLDPVNAAMHKQTEILLYAADRSEHVHQLIRPSLEEGKVVICDRYMDSSIAYQGYGFGHTEEEIEKIKQISLFATDNLIPHRTYLIDIPVEESFKRMGIRANETNSALDRIEQRYREFHERVRNGFLAIAKKEPDRVMVVDGMLSPEGVFEVVWNDMKQLLGIQ
jgi:dTMP kinase